MDYINVASLIDADVLEIVECALLCANLDAIQAMEEDAYYEYVFAHFA